MFRTRINKNETAANEPPNQNKKGYFARMFSLTGKLLGVNNWKRTFTKPVQYVGKKGSECKDRLNDIYHQYDDLEPTTDANQLRLAMKKSKTAAPIYFATSLVPLGAALNTQNLFQTAVCIVVSLILVLSGIASAVVYSKAKGELANAEA